MNTPADVDAENGLLSYFVSRPDLVRRYPVSPSCFWNERNRRVYRLMVSMSDADEPIDEVTLGRKLFPDATAPHFAFADFVKLMLWPRVKPEWCEYFVRRLQECAYKREMVKLEESITAKQAQNDSNPEEIEDERRQKQRQLRAEFYPPESDTDPGHAWQRLVSAVDAKVERMSTGFGAVDSVCGELTLGMVVTVLAKAGVGKSYFASNVIVNHLHREAEYGVAFASLEMSDTMTTKRVVKQFMRWDDPTFAKWSRTEDSIFVEATHGRYCHIAIPRTTLPHLERFLDRWEERHGRPVLLLVIDFLQYLKPTERGMSRYDQVSSLTRDVKELAKRRNCVVALLSQVRRDKEGKDDAGYKCPSLESGRDSGTIEENADVMLGLWRDKRDDRLLYVRGLKVREGARNRDASLRFDWSTGRIAEVWE